MRGHLSTEISVTRLKRSVERYRRKIKEQVALLREKDRKIFALEQKLVDKESQRKELLSYLYKTGKKTEASKPRGKKPWCSHCETYVKSLNVPPITRIGRNAMGYILYARYRLRLPMKKIQESLLDLYDFKISEGEIVDTLKDAETLFGKDYEAIIVLIQEAKAVYADETGWRMNGRNWWLWVFATITGTQYVIEDTRGKGVPERMLGRKEDRVIISDGYATYQNLKGDKQQCWIHLLRAAKLHSLQLYGDLVVLYKKLLLELEKPVSKRNKEQLKKKFTALIEKLRPCGSRIPMPTSLM